MWRAWVAHEARSLQPSSLNSGPADIAATRELIAIVTNVGRDQMGANRQAHIRCALAPDIMAQDVMVQDVMARGCAASNNDANALTMRGCRSEAKECVRTVVEHDIRRRPPLRARRQIGLLTPLAFRPGRLTGIFRRSCCRSHCQPRQLDRQCAAGRDGHVLFPDDGSPSHGGRLAC